MSTAMFTSIRTRPLQLRQLMLFRFIRANSNSTETETGGAGLPSQSPPAQQTQDGPAHTLNKEESRRMVEEIKRENAAAEWEKTSRELNRIAQSFLARKGYKNHPILGRAKPDEAPESFVAKKEEVKNDKVLSPEVPDNAPESVVVKEEEVKNDKVSKLDGKVYKSDDVIAPLQEPKRWVSWSMAQQEEFRQQRMRRKQKRESKPTTAKSFGRPMPNILRVTRRNLPEDVENVPGPPVIYTGRRGRVLNIDSRMQRVMEDETLMNAIVDPRYIRVTYIGKPTCDLCAPALEIFERLKRDVRYIAISRFRSIDLDQEQNESWRQKYAYDIPVMTIELTDEQGRNKKHFMHKMTWDEVHGHFRSLLRLQRWPFRETDKDRFDAKQERWESELYELEQKVSNKAQRELEKEKELADWVETNARKEMSDEVW